MTYTLEKVTALTSDWKIHFVAYQPPDYWLSRFPLPDHAAPESLMLSLQVAELIPLSGRCELSYDNVFISNIETC